MFCIARLEYKMNILTQRVRLSQSFSMGLKVNLFQGKFNSKVSRSMRLSLIIDNLFLSLQDIYCLYLFLSIKMFKVKNKLNFLKKIIQNNDK